MNAFTELAPYWLLLTGLCVTMVYGGGIEWIHRRDMGPFSNVPVVVWKRLHQFIWLLGAGAFAVAIVL